MSDNQLFSSLRIQAFVLGLTLLILGLPLPVQAFHFPWDQGHDTTDFDDPSDPGNCKDGECKCDTGNCDSTRSPVYLATGHFIWTDTDVALKGRPYLGLSRTYNSHDAHDGLFGNGWTFDHDRGLFKSIETGDSGSTIVYTLRLPNGKHYVFRTRGDGVIVPPPGVFQKVLPQSDGTLLLVSRDGSYDAYAYGKLIAAVDRNGNRLNYHYDVNGMLTSIDDGNGRSLDFGYNSGGRIGAVTDQSGRTWKYGYDDLGNLATVTDPLDGVTTYSYQKYQAAGDGQIYYHLNQITDPTGVILTQVVYDGEKVSSYTEGGNTYTYSYRTDNRTVTKTDSVGSVWKYAYDANGMAITETDPLNHKVSYQRDDNGLATQTTDALGNNWLTAWDGEGRRLGETSPLNQVTQYEYAPDTFWPNKITSPGGRVTQITYDNKANPLAVTDPAGFSTNLQWNIHGDLVAKVNALGETTGIEYNALGLPVKAIDPLGHETLFTYDAVGNLTKLVNANGETTEYQYDALDRLVLVKDALGHTVSYSYDAAGRLVKLTDERGNPVAYAYDAFGRIAQQTERGNLVTAYAYRADNLVSTITRPDNTQVVYTYDAAGKVLSENVAGDTETFAYNARNELTKATNAAGSIDFQYDSAGRMVSQTSNGQTITHAYNADDEQVKLSALGKQTDYTFDQRGLLSSIVSPSGTFSFAYDDVGRRSQLNYPDGGKVQYGFDAASRLTQMNHTGAFTANYLYAYDAVGQMTQWRGDGADWNYGYDAAGRLTQAIHSPEAFAYAYDASGNRLDMGGVYDVANRLNSDTTYTYTYDVLGNLTKKQHKTTGEHTDYAWDKRNRLVKVEHFANGNTATAADKVLAYSYGPLGQRWSKAVDGVMEKYVYDRMDRIATLDLAGKTVNYLTFGGMIDEPLGVSVVAGERFFHVNHQRSVMATTSVGGTIVTSYSYSPFGETRVIGERDYLFQFTGRELDLDDFYFYRTRYYDAHAGRFISVDKLETDSGETNFYGYVGGDPINYIDPNGEFVNLIIGCLGGVASGLIVDRLIEGECSNYGLKDGLIDCAAGAVGAGLASKLNKIYRISKLRSIAKSRGLNNLGRQGYTETWGGGKNGLERLNIKFEGGKSAGLHPNSKVPRFDYRVDAGKYWDPFAGKTGPKGALSHVPLEPQLSPGTNAGAGAAAGAGAQATQSGCCNR